MPAASCASSSSRDKNNTFGSLRSRPCANVRSPRRTDARWNQPLIKREDKFIINQNIEPPCLVFELANLANQPQVVRQKWRAGFELTVDERCTNKCRAAAHRWDRMRPGAANRRPVHRALRARTTTSARFFSQCGSVWLFFSRWAPTFEPNRFYGRDRSRIEARCLNQLRGDPSSCLFSSAEPGQMKNLMPRAPAYGGSPRSHRQRERRHCPAVPPAAQREPARRLPPMN